MSLPGSSQHITAHLRNVPRHRRVIEALPLVVGSIVDVRPGLAGTTLVDPAGAVNVPGVDTLVVVPGENGEENVSQCNIMIGEGRGDTTQIVCTDDAMFVLMPALQFVPAT